ncbi:MAG: TrbI/VirB10 family protein [Pseudomonadota bacterium]
MAVTGSDPRGAVEVSARPVVARAGRGTPNWMIVAGVLVAGLILFLILDSRRRQLSAPATSPRAGTASAGGTTPQLYIPPEPAPPPPPLPPPPLPPPPPPPPKIVYVPAPPVPQPAPVPLPPPPRTSADPVLVIDTTTGDATATAPGGDVPGAAAAPGGGALTVGGRARATMMRNRTTTVPEGTLIPAVLETALDSTRPGPARAIVTRDVRGFDGKQILIQRGSRLIGEYKADLQPGQNRALVIWTRLVRPDGATIALASPAADPLGRVGIKGKVNSHFLERFASALLQTTLSVGVGLASSLGSNNNLAILALPGTAGASGLTGGTDQVLRTLRVKQGVSISVFVARDLDFTAVESKK